MKPVTQAEQSSSPKIIADAEKDLSNMCVRFALKGGAFMSIIFYSLQKEITDSVPTAATNGKKILVNPKFWLGLNTKEKLFLLAHEVMHIALMHLTRRGDRDPELWNIAGDYAINAILAEEFSEADLIPGALYNEKFYNWPTEKIYEYLQDRRKNIPKDAIGSDIQEGEAKSCEIQQVVTQAAQMAEIAGGAIGLQSDVMKQMLQSLKEPTIHWKDALYDFVSKRCKEAYSFTRRNRRYSSVYLPSMYSLGMGAVGVYMDVSGSVDTEDIRRFLGAVQSLQTDCSPERVDICSFNTEIQDRFSYPRGELVPDYMDLQVSGGTNINCVYEDFAQKDYDCIVIFTDGCFHAPRYETPNNILWIIYDDDVHQFSNRINGGKTIYVDK